MNKEERIKKCLANIEDINISENNNASGTTVKNINDFETYKIFLDILKDKSINKKIKDRTGRYFVRLHADEFAKKFKDAGLNVNIKNDETVIDREISQLNALNKKEGLEGFKFGRRVHKNEDGQKVEGEFDIKLYTDYKPLKKE